MSQSMISPIVISFQEVPGCHFNFIPYLALKIILRWCKRPPHKAVLQPFAKKATYEILHQQMIVRKYITQDSIYHKFKLYSAEEPLKLEIKFLLPRNSFKNGFATFLWDFSFIFKLPNFTFMRILYAEYSMRNIVPF